MLIPKGIEKVFCGLSEQEREKGLYKNIKLEKRISDSCVIMAGDERYCERDHYPIIHDLDSVIVIKKDGKEYNYYYEYGSTFDPEMLYEIGKAVDYLIDEAKKCKVDDPEFLKLKGLQKEIIGVLTKGTDDCDAIRKIVGQEKYDAIIKKHTKYLESCEKKLNKEKTKEKIKSSIKEKFESVKSSIEERKEKIKKAIDEKKEKKRKENDTKRRLG